MIRTLSNSLAVVALVFVFFLFVFSMPIDQDNPTAMISAIHPDNDVCDVFYTGHGRFYCEFGDVTCERLLYEQCFGK